MQESRSVYHSHCKSPHIPHQMQESRYTTAFARVQIRSVCTTNAGVHIYHTCVTECILCVQGHDPLIFSFLSSFPFFDWVGVLWPQLSKVLKLVPGPATSSPPPPLPPHHPTRVPAEAGCLFAVAAGVHVFISGDSLHCFLVGVNKSYVIATSDL